MIRLCGASTQDWQAGLKNTSQHGSFPPVTAVINSFKSNFAENNDMTATPLSEVGNNKSKTILDIHFFCNNKGGNEVKTEGGKEGKREGGREGREQEIEEREKRRCSGKQQEVCYRCQGHSKPRTIQSPSTHPSSVRSEHTHDFIVPKFTVSCTS